jgi:hypothetical protein
MKRFSILLIMTGLAALGTNAQTVTGSGTTNTVPKFTGSSTIGDSVIAESNGNIGVGAGAINFFLDGKLTVLDIRDVNASGVGPTSIYGIAQCKVNNFCAAVRGDVHSGFAHGLIGIQYVEDGQSGGGGVQGISFGTTGFNSGVFGDAHGSTGSGAGVLGTAESPEGTGVIGKANASTGTTLGVLGQTNSDEGIGVLGNRGNPTASGFGGGGVRGVTSAANFVFTYGTSGVATANTGSAVGVFGQAYSPQGVAGLFANVAGGDIIRGGVNQPEITVFRVDGNGTVHANGGFRPFGADFAESVAVKGGPEHYAPGDLLVIDPSGERRLSLSQTPYSTLVAGIYSTQPGVVASTHRVDEAIPNNEVPLAVVGIVPCKVTAENGPIMAGDLLVTSSTPGHAMKGTDRARMLGAVVGKALEPLRQGTGEIQVLVTLQ